MATISKLKSVHTSLSTTTVDIVNLLQFWDAIEVSNRDATNHMYMTYNGVSPTAAGDNTEIIEAGTTKIFPAYKVTGGIPGDTSNPCHQIRVIGSGNAYSVIGVAGQ
jgi:hypothetical protein